MTMTYENICFIDNVASIILMICDQESFAMLWLLCNLKIIVDVSWSQYCKIG